MAQAMIMPKKYFFDKDNLPLAFGKIYTYQAGTTTNKPTFTTEVGDVANSNPVILNGEAYAPIYLNGSYKIVVHDSNDNLIWSEDPVSSSGAEEWVNCEVATYLTATSFKSVGDTTKVYEEGRAIRIDNDVAEFSYSIIISSSFSGGETTIVITDAVVTPTLISVCASIVGPKSSGVGGAGVSEILFANVTDMQSGATKIGTSYSFSEGDQCSTGKTTWDIVSAVTLMPVTGGLYAKAIGDVFLDDFDDGVLTDSEMVHKAHNYCKENENRNRLVFEDKKSFNFGASDSFIIYVEGGGWYCADMCALRWDAAPTAGFAVNIQGRYTGSTSYQTRLNDSNFRPMEGFTIGEANQQRTGVGLKLGYADTWQTNTNAKVTSKWIISRVNVFEFDDVIEFWTGVWACELHHVNTIGGSWKTPTFFVGLDYGENIKLSHCFVGDNHLRLVDGEPGSVVFSAGEFVIFGGSFDNMRVTVAGDALVTMHSPHFENPVSTAKNKVFLEVTGSFAHCVLNQPTIVMRSTDVYSNVFSCIEGDGGNQHPFAGGLVLNSPRYNSNGEYRPDLAVPKGIEDATTYEGDSFLTLVGGGGRVYLTGGVAVNSLFFSFNPIPVARNLVGAATYNPSFDIGALGEFPSYWIEVITAPYSASGVVSNEESWEGTTSLKTTCDYNGGATWNSSRVYQDVDCSHGQLVLANIKLKWIIELTGAATGPITGSINAAIDFYDKMGNYISTGWSEQKSVTGNSTGTYDGWETMVFTGHAPAGTYFVRFQLTSFSTSDDAEKKIHTYWDTAVLNVL